jgi:hypothetical protein
MVPRCEQLQSWVPFLPLFPVYHLPAHLPKGLFSFLCPGQWGLQRTKDSGKDVCPRPSKLQSQAGPGDWNIPGVAAKSLDSSES